MKSLRSLLPAALIAALGFGAGALATGTVTVPAVRSLGVAALYDDTTSPPQPIGISGHPLQVAATFQGAGNNGTDRSANPISVSGMTLITTVPANPSRVKLVILIACAAGAVIDEDDGSGSGGTYTPVAGGAADGQQGGQYVTTSHLGRVRVYSTNASCTAPGREQ